MIDKIRLSINVADCPDERDMRVVASDAIASVGGTPELNVSRRTGVECVGGKVGEMYVSATAGGMRISGSLPKHYYQGYGVLTIEDYREAIESLSEALFLPVEALKRADVLELEVHRDIRLVEGQTYASFSDRFRGFKGWREQSREIDTRYYISERAKPQRWRKQGKRVRVYNKSEELRVKQRLEISECIVRIELTLKGVELRRCGVNSARDIGLPEVWYALDARISELLDSRIIIRDRMTKEQVQDFIIGTTPEIDMLALMHIVGGYDEAKGSLRDALEAGKISRNTYYTKVRLLDKAREIEGKASDEIDPIEQALRSER